jgi:hypothetical protein
MKLFLITRLILLLFCFSALVLTTDSKKTKASKASKAKSKSKKKSKYAVVTLVTGENSGYSAGAIALGQSIRDTGSTMDLVVLVTPEVSKGTRESMKKVRIEEYQGFRHIIQIVMESC